MIKNGFTQRERATVQDVSRSVVARLWRCYQESREKDKDNVLPHYNTSYGPIC